MARTPRGAMPHQAGRRNSGRHRRTGAAVSALALVLLAGCAGDPGTRESPASGSLTHSAAAGPLNLSAELIRSRRDEANERLRVRLTNLGDQTVQPAEIRLVSPPYTPEPAQLSTRSRLNPGQPVDFRVRHGEPECVGDDPSPGAVAIEVTAGDQHATLDPGPSADLISRMLALACARQRVLDVVRIQFDTEWDLADNGTEQTGTLLVERLDGGPPITVTAVRGGINYTLELIDPTSQPTLAESDRTLAIPVHSRGARCGGHALADNSKPFTFSVWISLDGAPETHIEFDAAEQQENFVRLCSSR